MLGHELEPDRNNRLFNQIRAGMDVYDREGKKVGQVEHVYPGNLSDESGELGAGEAGPTYPGLREEGSLVDAYEEAFDPAHELAEEMRDHLWHQGFIRINGPDLSDAGHYVTEDQIEEVTGDSVRLNVARQDLVEA